MKSKKNKIEENIKKFEEEINERKKLPIEEKKKVKKEIIINSIFFGIILLLLVILNIAEENISTDIYLLILKIISIILCIISVVMLEISYKTNKNSIILKTLEIVILMFFTIFLRAAYSLYYGQFYKVIIVAIVICAIYYIIKTILSMKRIKKMYYKSLNDIKTIVAK